jgi:hypothetical protein
MASTLKPTLCPAACCSMAKSPCAAFPEAEVVTDHQVPGAQAADQDVLDELLGSEGGKAALKRPM